MCGRSRPIVRCFIYRPGEPAGPSSSVFRNQVAGKWSGTIIGGATSSTSTPLLMPSMPTAALVLPITPDISG